MKKVLVTGAEGFLGKNLIAALEELNGIEVIKYDLDNSFEQLVEYLQRAEFIIHLAGVNRPKEISEYESGNKGFTELLIQLLKQYGKKTPLIFTSSIQAALDNPYGISKRNAEKAVIQYQGETGADVFVYRLPNVFGKWCRPNYNSVVATFCHNIANGIRITVNHPEQELYLVYVDDVVSEFKNVLYGNAPATKEGYCNIDKIYKATVQSIADKIQAFYESRKNLIMPDLKNDFDKALYATYLSYLPSDKLGYDLDMRYDDRGWLAEFIKSNHLGQIFVSRTKPGITRGNHWHHTKVEKFLVIEGEAVIRLRRIKDNNIFEYKASGKELKVYDIPPGYTHSITNTGKNDAIVIFWASEIFNQEKPDTYSLEVEV